jgi:hypothetical protein
MHLSVKFVRNVRLFLVGQQQVGWVPPPRGPVSFPRVAPAAACAGNTPAFSRYLLTRNLKSHPSHSFRLMQSSAHLPVAAFYNAAAGSALLHILIAWHTRILRAPHTHTASKTRIRVSLFLFYFFIQRILHVENYTMKMRRQRATFRQLLLCVHFTGCNDLRVKRFVKVFFYRRN